MPQLHADKALFAVMPRKMNVGYIAGICCMGVVNCDKWLLFGDW